MTITHDLKNTGTKAISTNVYNHASSCSIPNNGPDFTVTFPFDAKGTRDMNGLAEVRGKQIVYLKQLQDAAPAEQRQRRYRTNPSPGNYSRRSNSGSRSWRRRRPGRGAGGGSAAAAADGRLRARHRGYSQIRKISTFASKITKRAGVRITATARSGASTSGPSRPRCARKSTSR